MDSSVYVASLEGFTGKSMVALGLLERLSRVVSRVGVFRPIVRADRDGCVRDYVLDLLTPNEAVVPSSASCAGVTYDDVHADPAAAMDQIVERYHRVAALCDAVIVVGSDYTDVGTPTEFSYNARIAANLGTPVLLVLNGADREPADLGVICDMAAAELRANQGTLTAVIANRVDPARLEEDLAAIRRNGVLAFAIADQPLLAAPSVADLVQAIGGTMVHGDPSLQAREVTGLVVADMSLPNVLERLFEGAIVVTPGDRPEIVVGVVSAHVSTSFPQVSGVVLSGGLALPDPILRLLGGIGATLPILSTPQSTHETSTAMANVRGRLTRDSPRKVAAALTLFDTHVDAAALIDRLEVARTDAVTPLMFEHMLVDRATQDRRHIVLPEGENERVIRAADILLRRGVVDLTLLGSPFTISARAASLGADVSDARLLSPQESGLLDLFAEEYYQRRRHKGVDREEALTTVADFTYFGTLMVELGLVDGLVSGAAHTTAHTLRPALELVKTLPDVSVVSSVFFMCLADQVLVYGDCAVNPDPSAEQLADIAISSATTAASFGIEPRVAMLSYATGTSSFGVDVEKVCKATALVHERAPELLVEGPIQYDAAIDLAVAEAKLPTSQVAGRATVFVFPDLNTGNNTYKAVQRAANAVAVGPVLQGLRKPINDLSRGSTVRDIVNTVAITAIQAQRLAPLQR